MLVLKRPGGREKHSATGSRRTWLAEKEHQNRNRTIFGTELILPSCKGSSVLIPKHGVLQATEGGCSATEQVDNTAKTCRNRQCPRVECYTSQREQHTRMRRRIKILHCCICNWPLFVPLHCQVSAGRVRRAPVAMSGHKRGTAPSGATFKRQSASLSGYYKTHNAVRRFENYLHS